MNTELRAPTELFAISAFAELAVWERRPELQRLLVSGAAAGKVDPAIVGAALPGLSESACRNLLRTLEHLKLIDADGAISAFGSRCVKTAEAPAWELGVFTFLVAKHPCFGAWPIGFQRERAAGNDLDFQRLTELPSWFSADPKQIWTSGFDDRERFTISNFPSQPGQSTWCRSEGLAPAQLVWTIDLSTGKNAIHVEGSITEPKGARAFRTLDRTVPTAEITPLFPSWEPRWDASTGRVLMPYDGAAHTDGLDSFTRVMTYPNVQAGRRGTFEVARVEGVPVGPPSPDEARAWATALALARVAAADAYVTPEGWRRTWDATLTKTPLQAGAGVVPDVSALLDRQNKLPPRLRWLLATGTDLAME